MKAQNVHIWQEHVAMLGVGVRIEMSRVVLGLFEDRARSSASVLLPKLMDL